jgi:signal transduction histidine kinase
VVATFNAVLRLSRLEAGEGGRFAQLDLSAMMADLGDLYEPSLADVGMSLRCEIEPGVMAQADGSLIMLGMTNLLDDAIKYARSGEVVLELRALSGGRAELSVSDHGPGIAPAERAKALERFGRLDSARSSAGTGLGLALAVAVAEAHKGSLELSDTLPADKGLREPMVGLRVALIVPTQQG